MKGVTSCPSPLFGTRNIYWIPPVVWLCSHLGLGCTLAVVQLGMVSVCRLPFVRLPRLLLSWAWWCPLSREWESGGDSLVVVASRLVPICEGCLGLVFLAKGMEFRCMGVLVAVQGSLVLLWWGVRQSPWLACVVWTVGERVWEASGELLWIGRPLLHVCWPSASFCEFWHHQWA